MKKLLLFAALLALPIAGQEVARMARKQIAPAPEPVAVPAPEPEPQVVLVPPIAPAGAVVVWRADPRCTDPVITRMTLPDAARTECLAREGRLAVLRALRREMAQPGPAGACRAYRDPEYSSCLDFSARSLPGIGFGYSGRYVSAYVGSKPYRGCVAGMSSDPVFISLAESASRVASLSAWEPANHFLWAVYDRQDLADGALVDEATKAALAACPGN